MAHTSSKISFLGPLLNSKGVLSQRFTSLVEEAEQMGAFKRRQDEAVLEHQRQTMSAKDFELNTGNGQYPYYGASGGGYSYIFTPGAVGHTLMVRNNTTKHVLSLPYADRRPQGEDAAEFEFTATVEKVLAWLESTGVRTANLNHWMFAFEFTPTSLGTTSVVSLPTGERLDVTEYGDW